MKMKKFRFLVVTLAACMIAASLAACYHEYPQYESGKEETEVAETTSVEMETETSSTEREEVLDTEVPAETEPEVDLSLYQEGSFYDFQNDEAAAEWFDISRDLATQIHDEDPDAEMYYGIRDNDGTDFHYNHFYFGSVGWGWNDDDDCTFDWYEWDEDTGEIVFVEGTEENFEGPYVSYTYENYMKLPMLIRDERVGNLGPMEFEDSTPDGDYNCMIRAVSLDGTKVFAFIQEPIFITAEEYFNIKPGDHLTLVDDDPRFPHELNVRDDFSFDDPTNMFVNNTLFFQECEDGNYVLVSTHGNEEAYRCFYTCYKTRMVFLDISPDCVVIEDDHDSETPYGFVDGPNAFTRSFYFFDRTKSKPVVYNDWIRLGSKDIPIIVKDNTIVQMELQ